MNFRILDEENAEEVAALFTAAFASSEGAEEGARVGKLAAELASQTDNREIICLGACEGDTVIGAIFFTRLDFNRPVEVFLLAPVAVAGSFQGKGVGQALIEHGLNELRSRSVDLAITYGDPSFYSRVGFSPLSTATVQPPLPLSLPHGWLGQSLNGEPIPTLRERPSCVQAFRDPVYW